MNRLRCCYEMFDLDKTRGTSAWKGLGASTGLVSSKRMMVSPPRPCLAAIRAWPKLKFMAWQRDDDETVSILHRKRRTCERGGFGCLERGRRNPHLGVANVQVPIGFGGETSYVLSASGLQVAGKLLRGVPGVGCDVRETQGGLLVMLTRWKADQDGEGWAEGEGLGGLLGIVELFRDALADGLGLDVVLGVALHTGVRGEVVRTRSLPRVRLRGAGICPREITRRSLVEAMALTAGPSFLTSCSLGASDLGLAVLSTVEFLHISVAASKHSFAFAKSPALKNTSASSIFTAAPGSFLRL